jgi:flagellin
MTSLITNSSAMNALSALRSVNQNLSTVQGRISSGLQITSAKDNAAYFQISETMKGDSGSISAINEGLTLTKNSIATARLGAETFQDLANKFVEKVAFAQGAKGGYTEIEKDLGELVKQMEVTIKQSTFNGDDMVNASQAGALNTTFDMPDGTGAYAAPAFSAVLDNQATPAAPNPTTDRSVVTGISRDTTGIAVTTTSVETVDLSSMLAKFSALKDGFATKAAAATTTADAGTAGDPSDDYAMGGEAHLSAVLVASEGLLKEATDAATQLGLSEKTIEVQQDFLTRLADNIDTGVGSMIDANMEEEAARLQALQTQQQLATQALSIANQGPASIMALFR